ncbi:MAG: MFS transporter [Pseudolysinimonas sp.]
MSAAPDANLTPEQIRSARRRGHIVLISGQALAGVGMGATLSSGALLVTQVSGSEALSGMAATGTTVGAAIAAIPLAALARRAGRAPSLATGALIAAAGAGVGLLAAVLVSLPLLLCALVLIGVGTAVNLQSRFAATDLSEPGNRGRDLALVVWATTVGAVLGPNLIAPADAFGRSLGLPSLSGPFLFTIAAQILAAAIYLIFLRPDPLKLADRIGRERDAAGLSVVDIPKSDPSGVRTGMIALALSHATMVSVMAMTPVHLVQNGATLVVVGLTISLHVAGMFALSPVFGWLADRVGREVIIALGQVLLLAALLLTSFGADYQGAVMAGLILIGLGWSASTVAGSALVAESADPLRRTVIQGRADLLMSASGAVGGALAGPALALLAYNGLALAAVALVVVVLIALALRSATLAQRVA